MDDLGLRALLWILAAYHLGIGLLSLLSHPATARVARGLYDIAIESSPQLRYAVRMLGVYALAFGFLLCLAASDPASHAVVVGAAVFVLGARAVCRLAFARQLTHAFGVSAGRNRAHAALLLAAAALLVWWFPG